MKPNAPSEVWAVRTLASEGRYHIYRQLAQGHRFFVGAKLASVALGYWRGRGSTVTSTRVALVKGVNQHRHHRHTEEMRTVRLGPVEAFSTSPSLDGMALFPRITTQELLILIVLAARVLIMGRRRDLSLYMLFFYYSAKRIINQNLQSADSFICYNDQPFDVAAFVYALSKRGACNTIVIQHGLILTPDFYFPTHAHEFWAWGALSREHFSTRNRFGVCKITGRYSEDARKKSSSYVNLPEMRQINILLAFSSFHKDIISGIRSVDDSRNGLPENLRSRLRYSIKLHPATRSHFLLKKKLKKHSAWLTIVDGDMENLAEIFDVLITHNSSSAVDFLLRGKITISAGASSNGHSPSSRFLWRIDDMMVALESDYGEPSSNEALRSKYLELALNV